MKIPWTAFMAAEPPYHAALLHDIAHEKRRVGIRAARDESGSLLFLRLVAKIYGYSYEEVDIDWNTEHNKRILSSLKANGVDTSQWCLVFLNRLDA